MYIKVVKKYNLKRTLWTGYSTFRHEEILNNLDYLKVGPYVEEKGGIDNPNTNQRFYEIENGKIKNDITSMFWKEEIKS